MVRWRGHGMHTAHGRCFSDFRGNSGLIRACEAGSERFKHQSDNTILYNFHIYIKYIGVTVERSCCTCAVWVVNVAITACLGAPTHVQVGLGNSQ